VATGTKFQDNGDNRLASLTEVEMGTPEASTANLGSQDGKMQTAKLNQPNGWTEVERNAFFAALTGAQVMNFAS
jgi:hypothetical protein